MGVGVGMMGEEADQVRCVGRVSQVQTQHGQRSGGGKGGGVHGPAHLEHSPREGNISKMCLEPGQRG